MQAAKRAAPAVGEGEAQAPKKAKAATPANGAASGSGTTPAEGGKKRGRPTNKEVRLAIATGFLRLLMLHQVLLLLITPHAGGIVLSGTCATCAERRPMQYLIVCSGHRAATFCDHQILAL